MLVGELASVTYSKEVSVTVVKVVCAKAPFLTVTVIVPNERVVLSETDHSVKVEVEVVSTETHVQPLEADDVADQYEFHWSQQFPVKARVSFFKFVCDAVDVVVDISEASV